MRVRTAALVVLAALTTTSLAACEGRPGPKGAAAGGGICTPFAEPTALGAGSDPSTPLDDCLHRWAYRLAGASDPADVVGQAAVAACHPPLSRWNQQSLAADPGDAMSLTTGEPVSATAAHYDFARSRALFYVVQARAGRCPAPPPAPAAQPG